jgi:uncharacterized protein YndB with AHSA1/START domain
MQLEYSIEVERELDEVWQMLTAPDVAQQYLPQFKRVELVSGPREGVGERRMRATLSNGRLPMSWTERVVKYDPPLRFVSHSLFGHSEVESDYTLSRANDRTVVKAIIRAWPSLLTALLWPLNRFLVKRAMNDAMARFQQYLQQGRAAYR